MNSEYLVLNIIILSGPLFLSFDRRVRFVRYWPKLFPVILAALIPFIIWDSLVTGRHWWFNGNYTLPYRLLGLPPGEWLFFITVPYACVFIWEVLRAYFKNKQIKLLHNVQIYIAIIFFIFGFVLLQGGKEYTTIVTFTTGYIFFMDFVFKTRIFEQRLTYIFSLILILLMLIFNGFLTARPVLLYNPEYQLDFRIFTIPIEDFFYCYSLIFFVIILFEKLKRRKNG
jgi:lycopene cyclase domain-containing protein